MQISFTKKEDKTVLELSLEEDNRLNIHIHDDDKYNHPPISAAFSINLNELQQALNIIEQFRDKS